MKPALRPASVVMSLQRAAAAVPNALSFSRTAMRELVRGRWKIEKPRFELDEEGRGEVLYRLVGTGIDQPGLVHRLAHLLREQNVNIESLETRLTPAPYTGAPMFELEALLSVPRTTSLSGLRKKLGAACDEVNMDWDLRTA